MQEKMCPVLMTSVHDTVRNEAAKKRREDLRLQAELEEKRKNESEMDYLAPFLAQMGDPAELTRVQAKQLKEDALHDLKTRLIQQANMIQERFDRETGKIHLLSSLPCGKMRCGTILCSLPVPTLLRPLNAFPL